MKIFIVNQGFPWYLDLVLTQIEATNGKENLILLLDQHYLQSQKYRVLLMKDYSEMADRFAKAYKSFFQAKDWHRFELIWFQRYMFILDYLRSIDWQESFWILDSDVLVYSDLARISFSQEVQFTKLGKRDLCFMYFQSKKVLKDLCNYFLDAYENHLVEIEAFYQENYVKTGAAGGICEMILLQWYSERVNTSWKDLSLPQDGWCFDRGLQEPDGFQKNLLGGKKVRLVRGRPYFLKKKEKIAVHGLHCQGVYKNLIPLLTSVPVSFKKRLIAWKWVFSRYLTLGVKNIIKKGIGRSYLNDAQVEF